MEITPTDKNRELQNLETIEKKPSASTGSPIHASENRAHHA